MSSRFRRERCCVERAVTSAVLGVGKGLHRVTPDLAEYSRAQILKCPPFQRVELIGGHVNCVDYRVSRMSHICYNMYVPSKTEHYALIMASKPGRVSGSR
jgi:hypothetical protein